MEIIVQFTAGVQTRHGRAAGCESCTIVTANFLLFVLNQLLFSLRIKTNATLNIWLLFILLYGLFLYSSLLTILLPHLQTGNFLWDDVFLNKATEAQCNGSNLANAGFLALAISSAYPPTCWEWVDIVLTQVSTALDEITVNVTWVLGVEEMFFCVTIQLQSEIWRGRWCHRPMMSYIKMICRR
jgi:uncharacterized protein with PQ loop repeat